MGPTTPHEVLLLPYVVGILSVVFSLLVASLVWIGAQVHKRLDNITTAMGLMNATLNKIDADLRNDLHILDTRLTRVEATCRIVHGQDVVERAGGFGFHGGLASASTGKGAES